MNAKLHRYVYHGCLDGGGGGSSGGGGGDSGVRGNQRREPGIEKGILCGVVRCVREGERLGGAITQVFPALINKSIPGSL